MTTTPNMQMPYLVASQAQKEITHNEAISDLDALAQLSIVDRHLTVPPASPAEGSAYIVGPSATGAWQGHEGKVALYVSGWRFKTPRAGWIAYAQDEARFLAYDGSAWVFLGTRV